MSRTPFSASRPRREGTFRPQLEALEHRLAPGSLLGSSPGPLIEPGDAAAAREREAADLAVLAGLPAGHHRTRLRTTSPVTVFDDPSAVLGTSILTRTDDQVRIHVKTSGLVPGGAYTAWWVVIDPGTTFADRKAGWATGFVAGSNGKANFTVSLHEGETLVSHPTRSGGSLQDALRAEIRVQLRFHGPADPDPARLSEQLTMFEPDGATDAQLTIHPPPA